ncbi:hypothetical protein ARMGADRAFT_1064859 [Armillaria gallica]|uniref:Uncharacterized protein n=1 Tax=Armillaria gallica TaxID=47427 RepID=A0A2H3DLD8_ARMGA|nr:hypothetical protein ARMGADRAFT_1064859 [Armillaria gallica]
MAYVHEGIQYTRTAFALTHLDNVTVMRFTANVSPAISFNTRHLWVTPYSYNDRPWTTMYTSPASIHYNATAISSVSRTVACVGIKPSYCTASTPADQAVIVIAIDTTATDTTMYRETRGNCGCPLALPRTYSQFGEKCNLHHVFANRSRRILLSGPDGDQGLFALKTEHSNLHGIWNSKLSSNWGCATPAVISEMVSKEFANIARESTLKIDQELAQAGSQCHSTSLKSLIRSGSDHRTGNVEKSLAREIYDTLHNTDIWRDSGHVNAAFCVF